MEEARKIEIGQFPDGAIQVNKPSQFMVRKNGAKGSLDAKIISPSGSEDDCFIAPVDSDLYCIRFVPRENGIHNIHVKFNGVHITGSPFRIKVSNSTLIVMYCTLSSYKCHFCSLVNGFFLFLLCRLARTMLIPQRFMLTAKVFKISALDRKQISL